MNTPPIALTIAGSDCSAGAGIQADLKTFRAYDIHGLSAVTCIVSETPKEVEFIHELPVEVVASQIRLLLKTYPVTAIKIGMLGSFEIAECVYTLIKDSDIPIVIDPVMVASTGDSFTDEKTIEFYKKKLLPACMLVTPNIPEALRLADSEFKAEGPKQERDLATHLHEVYQTSFVVKGGHSNTKISVDCLYDGAESYEFCMPRLNLSSTHGTGCTFSSAICAELAKGSSLEKATKSAKDFVYHAIKNRFTWLTPNKEKIHGLKQ